MDIFDSLGIIMLLLLVIAVVFKAPIFFLFVITLVLVSVVILFTLGGCSNPVSDVLNDMDRTTITYKNKK